MKIIEGLNRTKTETLRYFELSEEKLARSYGPGKWNVRQLLHHLADAETVLYDRIRRGIANPNQVVWGFDQDAWAINLEYESMPLKNNRLIYSHVRDAIIYLAARYYESAGGNQFVHSRTGVRSVKDEFDKVVWHNQSHLDQIRKALADGRR